MSEGQGPRGHGIQLTWRRPVCPEWSDTGRRSRGQITVLHAGHVKTANPDIRNKRKLSKNSAQGSGMSRFETENEHNCSERSFSSNLLRKIKQ